MNRLHIKRLLSIGTVSKGDDPEATILLFKSLDKIEKENLSEIIDDIHRAWNADNHGATHSWVRTVHDKFVIVDIGDDSFQVSWSREPDGGILFGSRQKVDVTETITPVSKTKEPEPGPVEKKGDLMSFDVESLSDDAKAHVEGLVAQIAELTETPEALPEDLPDLVTKRLDDQDAVIEKERVEKAALAKEVADLKDGIATEKYEARAADLENLLGKTEDVAPVLKALAKDSPEAFGKLDKMFDSLVVAKVYAPFLTELGDSSETGTAVDRIAAHAAEIRKNSPDTTLADAKVQAWSDHPELKVLDREGN